MKNKIEDYAHLYLGCEAISTDPKYINSEYGYLDRVTKDEGVIIITYNSFYSSSFHDFKLLLRPLSDITEIEALDCYNFSFPCHEIDDDKKIEHILNAFDPYIEEWAGGSLQGNSLVFIWALRKGFDLFGLIESGLAIDKTKNNLIV